MLPELAELDWIPHRDGAAALDGGGWLKLLGQPDLDRASLLVRETAQNSWDARLTHGIPSFEMHLHTLDAARIRILREKVFREEEALGLRKALRKPTVRVLEIFDRGTHGLRGPLHKLYSIPRDEPTDYVDFILGVGAPQGDMTSGGSYGFGKVVTYMTSEVGTLLVWSRTRVDGRPESRLVGSAIGPSFDIGGTPYTGRHWWGVHERPERGGPVLPLLDEDADALGTRLFSRGFEPGETGTSLMIIEPRLSDAQCDEELVERWRRAIVENLWPKIVSGTERARQMSVTLRHEGREVALVPDSDPRFRALSRCLQAVRARQADPDAVIPPKVEIHEIRSKRPKVLVGHLALTYFPHPRDSDDVTHHVALMRHQAELVVKYVKHPRAESDLDAWCGVFKPVAEVDEIYARSEPPAHDDWVSKGLAEQKDRTIVNTCFTKVKDVVKDYLAPRSLPSGAEGQVSVGGLSNALAAFAGRAVGTRVRPRGAGTTGKRGSGRSRKPYRAEIVRAEPLPGILGERIPKQRFRVTIEISARGRALLSFSRLAWAVEGGVERDRDGLLGGPPEIAGWVVNPGSDQERQLAVPAIWVNDGDTVCVDVFSAPGRALDVAVTLEGDN